MAALRLPLILAALLAPVAAAAGIGFEFHHRFSDRLREWAEARSLPGVWWPEKGTAEYYAALAHHDRALRGRSLATADDTELTFVDGNQTYRFSALGFLHYAVVELGKPNVTFLVALDTGSDLFWVPCDCQQCSSLKSGSPELATYSPSNSSTSQKVSCNSSFCDEQKSCSSATSSCPYSLRYLSANTSSSGVLVEDILYLTTEGANPQVVEAPIVFGCGRNQSGGFLDGAAPNGLFGLGMEKVSVPSILASKGLTSNSFSMCFGQDGVGRINFGDTGSSDQQETAFILDGKHPTYKINVTGMVVGNSSNDTSFDAIVDSGTSFTSLTDPMYTYLAESFNAQVKEKRTAVAPNFTFEYCYELSPTQNEIFLPDLNLTTNGGSVFSVTVPIIVIKTSQTTFVYCLAVLKITGININIIGQNFLTGHRVVFDRDRQVLGWKIFDCYTSDKSSTLNVTNPPSTLPAAPAPSGNTQEMAKSGEVAPLPQATPSSSSSSRSKMTASILCLALLQMLIFL